jgi:hypothetical protein
MWTKGNWGRGLAIGQSIYTWNTRLGGRPWCGDVLVLIGKSALDVCACVEIAPNGVMAKTPAWIDRQDPKALYKLEESNPDLRLDDEAYWLERVVSDVSYA